LKSAYFTGDGYCCFASEDGHIVSVSAFDDQRSAEAANAEVREWVGANLRDALPDPPEVLAGEVRRELSGQAQGGAEGQYVVVRQYDGLRSFERLAALADEHVVPVLRQAPGLRSHHVFASAGTRAKPSWRRCSTPARTRCARTIRWSGSCASGRERSRPTRPGSQRARRCIRRGVA
jgi:hypothetical protein